MAGHSIISAMSQEGSASQALVQTRGFVVRLGVCFHLRKIRSHTIWGVESSFRRGTPSSASSSLSWFLPPSTGRLEMSSSGDPYSCLAPTLTVACWEACGSIASMLPLHHSPAFKTRRARAILHRSPYPGFTHQLDPLPICSRTRIPTWRAGKVRADGARVPAG